MICKSQTYIRRRWSHSFLSSRFTCTLSVPSHASDDDSSTRVFVEVFVDTTRKKIPATPRRLVGYLVVRDSLSQ